MGQGVSGLIRRSARGIAVAAAVLLGGCYWTAVAPLMPQSAAETVSPIAPGRYVTSSGTAMTVGRMSGSVLPVTGESVSYSVRFDHMTGDFYLAEAVDSRGAIYFVLVQPVSNGFVERAMSCDDIATSAGARVLAEDEEGRCVFSRYDQLVNATWAAINRFRADPSYLPGTVYTR